jgi:hypothetical protein
MCDTECTSTVLFTVVGTSCFPRVLIMLAKCDAHADRQGSGHCRGQALL